MTKQAKPFSLEESTRESKKNEVSFLLKLSHELKTPIHGIRGISSYLNENWDQLDDITRRKSLSAILDASEGLTTLVDSLLSRTDDQEKIIFSFVKLDLVATTKKAVEICKNLHINRSDLTITLENTVDECWTIADPFWYGQLLTNLLSNSINYSKNGAITLKFKQEKINGIDSCTISVQDEGIGIPETELTNIFVPFNRGSRKDTYTKGTGLGIAICREIVEAHGGTITASNNQTIGSTVEFSIPIKI